MSADDTDLADLNSYMAALEAHMSRRRGEPSPTPTVGASEEVDTDPMPVSALKSSNHGRRSAKPDNSDDLSSECKSQGFPGYNQSSIQDSGLLDNQWFSWFF